MDQEFGKNSNLEEQLRQARALLQTAEGKALLSALTRDGGSALAEAGRSLRAGDAAGAKKALEQVLTPEERRALDRSSPEDPWKI